MRKVILLLTLLITSVTSWSQYYCITANQTGFAGYQTFPDGTTVTITRSGGGFGCPAGEYIGYPAGYPLPANPAGQAPFGFCGIGPYFIGNRGCDNGWRFDFSQPITDVRIRMVSLNDSDTVRLRIPPPFGPGPGGPGVSLPITSNMLSAWTSSCNGQYKAVATPNGRLSANGAPSGYSDVQIDVQNPFPPFTLSRLRVEAQRDPNNNSIDGVTFEICYKNDSCSLRFDVTADSPRCVGRPINLHAPDYPNTTHYWKNVNSGAPWTASGPGLANPVINPGTIFHSGLYIDSAVRGACTYIDTINIFMDVTPNKPNVTYTGPKCPGENDTVFANTNLPAGGDYWFYAFVPSGNVGPKKPINQLNYIPLNNIQQADAGRYWVYAQSPNGCISDTGFVDVVVNPPAFAAFSYIEKLGCEGDTIEFNNFSIGGSQYNWDFGDNTGIIVSKQPDTIHIYKNHPSYPISYTVRLTVGNGTCADDTTVNLTFDHPVIADFTVTDTLICQNTTITFTNNSTVAPTTIPNYRWLFRDGDSSTAPVTVDHKYTKVGIYDALLEVTDYLGCKDTMIKQIEVDSLGSIFFTVSDNEICTGDVIHFDGKYSPVGIINAIWDFKDGNTLYNKEDADHSFEEGGDLEIAFAADYKICPDTTYKVNIKVTPYPIVDLAQDTTICPNGEPVLINSFVANAIGDVKYRWNTEVKDSTPGIYVYHPGTYSVTADVSGCATTDSIKVYKKCFVDVPNVFTPNGDGNNEYFLPRELLSRGLSKFRMTIYNRWGTKVFETTSINGRGWDGKFNGDDQSAGVYVYLIEATFVNGDSEKYQGNITLLR